MDNMSRDKVEHYYLVTTAFLMLGMSSSNLNIWNATWNPHKEDPRGCWAHCIEVPKWQVNALPNRKEGIIKNLGLMARFFWSLSVAFGFFFLSFRHSVLCTTKGSPWSAIPIRNTERLNFCEQNLQETDQFKTSWRSGNYSGGCCLAEPRYQTSLNFIQMITITQRLLK
jgi:hypothetical protein